MLKLEIKITGKTTGDLEIALDEVRRLVGETYLSGANDNDTSSYSFDITGEEVPYLKSSDENECGFDKLFKKWMPGNYSFPLGHEPKIEEVYEHGQWWVKDSFSGATWSVVDAEGGDSVDGVSFEQVSEGEFE